MKEKMEHEAEQTSGTYIPPKEDEKEVVITAGVALEYIVSVVLAVSALVAVFALIWAKWTAFKVALTVFVAVALATAFGYHIADRRRRKK